MKSLADLVECYSGQAYAERPLALHWQGQRLLVAETLNRWRTPYGRAFQVRTTDRRVFELFYDEGQQTWHIEPIAIEETHSRGAQDEKDNQRNPTDRPDER